VLPGETLVIGPRSSPENLGADDIVTSLPLHLL